MTSLLIKDAIKIVGGEYPENPLPNQIYFDVAEKKFVWHVDGQWINYPQPFGWRP